MKFLQNLSLSLSLLVACTPSSAATSEPGQEYLIGLPAKMGEVEAKACFDQVLAVITGAGETSTITVYDAYNLTTVTTLEIPILNSVARGNPAARLNKLAKQVGEVRSFCKAAAQPGAKAQIRYPQFLERVSQACSPRPEAEPIVLVFGSPFYQAEPAFAFGPDSFPRDGALLLRSTKCPYGTADRNKLPPNTAVHFCYLKESAFQNGDAS